MVAVSAHTIGVVDILFTAPRTNTALRFGPAEYTVHGSNRVVPEVNDELARKPDIHQQLPTTAADTTNQGHDNTR